MGKYDQWHRLAGALAGRGTSVQEARYPEVLLREMARTLQDMTEEQWGYYAFSREPLEGKFTEEQKLAYTLHANACGREWAGRVAAQCGSRSPREIARSLGLQIRTPDSPAGGGQGVFAQFLPPDEITIFMDCVSRAGEICREAGCALLQRELLFDVLLAHELFHVIEERHSDEIYTRTEKVELWRRPFSNRSAIACLSEIAAMAFAQELLGTSCSPYVLDVLLIYSYDREAAWGLYDEICMLAGGEKEREQC